MRSQADIIYLAANKSISLPDADEYELWQLAAACGLHLTETVDQAEERRKLEDEAKAAEERRQAGHDSQERIRKAKERRQQRKVEG